MTPSCPGCRTGSTCVERDGHFFRRCDSRKVQRFRCKSCQRGFSQRRLAVFLGISRTTLVRRIRFLAQEARERHWRALLKRVSSTGRFANVQCDDLHTFGHSKCKPTSVCVVVDADERFILGHSMAQIPASGF